MQRSAGTGPGQIAKPPDTIQQIRLQAFMFSTKECLPCCRLIAVAIGANSGSLDLVQCLGIQLDLLKRCQFCG
ncbi:hypothetical protein D3C87_1795380 [compost metagenome]